MWWLTFLKDYLELIAYLIFTIFLYGSYKKSRLLRYKVLFYYYLVATILMVEAAVFFKMDNNWNYNLLFFLGIISFSWYFRSLYLIKTSKLIVTVSLIINLIIYCYYNFIEGHFRDAFNNYANAISFVSIVIYILLYFHQLMLNVKEESILLDFDFWFICGSLFYFLGTFFIILYYTKAPLEMRGEIWSFHSIILFISSVITYKGYTYLATGKNIVNVR